MEKGEHALESNQFHFIVHQFPERPGQRTGSLRSSVDRFPRDVGLEQRLLSLSLRHLSIQLSTKHMENYRLNKKWLWNTQINTNHDIKMKCGEYDLAMHIVIYIRFLYREQVSLLKIVLNILLSIERRSCSVNCCLHRILSFDRPT